MIATDEAIKCLGHHIIQLSDYICYIKNGPCKKASFLHKKAVFYKLNDCKNTAILQKYICKKAVFLQK